MALFTMVAPIAILGSMIATMTHAIPNSITSVSSSISFPSSFDYTPAVSIMAAPAGGSCKHHPGGGKCPESTPCCMNGYCSDNPRFCSIGCEPLNSWKETSCFPMTFCTNMREEFNHPRIADSRSYTGNPYQFDFVTEYNPEAVQVQDSKLKIAMRLDKNLNSFGKPQGLGSVVTTSRYMQYGKVSARIKTGSGSPGVVSAFIIRNEDPGDEIDFEIVGRDPTEAQTNYFYRTPPTLSTDLIDFSNSGKSSMGVNSALDFHEYEFVWMPDYIQWKIDNKVIRSVYRNETKDDNGDNDDDGNDDGEGAAVLLGHPTSAAAAVGGKSTKKNKRFPSTPARIQFGIWDGGQGANGTASWAGTPTDWSKPDQVYELQVDYVDIQCYHGGNVSRTWPPEGFGPTKKHDGPYATPGLDGGYSEGGESIGNREPIRPFVPFYKNPTLMVPTGCLLGIALVAVGTVEVVRRRRVARVLWA